MYVFVLFVYLRGVYSQGCVALAARGWLRGLLRLWTSLGIAVENHALEKNRYGIKIVYVGPLVTHGVQKR